MSVPEVKGIILVGVVDDLLRLKGAGEIDDTDLEARLEASDLALLDEKVDPARWYPVASYERMVELLYDVEGGRDPAYLRRRGEASAQRLVAAGVYQQLNALESGAKADSRAEFGRRVRISASLQGAMLRLGEWKVLDDPDHAGRVLIEVTDAAAFPEVMRIALEGFVTAASQVAGSDIRWYSERPSPSRILLRMDRDFAVRGTRASFDAI